MQKLEFVVEREVSDDNESYNNWVKGGMNFLGSAIGTRGSASDYEAMGQQIGLTEPQAKLFAAMSTGDISFAVWPGIITPIA